MLPVNSNKANTQEGEKSMKNNGGHVCGYRSHLARGDRISLIAMQSFESVGGRGNES